MLEYLGEGATVIFIDHERLEAQEEAARKEYQGLYHRALQEGPVPPPDRMLHSFSALEAEALSRFPVARSFALKDSDAPGRIDMGVEQPRSFFGNIQYFKEELSTLTKAGYAVIVFAETELQAERIAALLKEFAIEVEVADLSAGFVVPALKLLVVQENEIFGRRRRQPKSLKTTRSVAIDTFVELSPGDFVVHVNYGIGRFSSIERMRVLGLERDYIKIEYAEGEVVFVPIEQANLVQRYIGNEGEDPRLDRLGSKSWESRKAKVKASVEQLAERLIRIYARRKAARGFAFPSDTDWQLAFEAAFPYEETVDQIRCIEEVKADMESGKPMDRLICGDVGYGKTEIAMRAMFKAAVSGKQVALLAPTTILAEQHFENFRERVGEYPVRMAMLSRLVEKKEQRKTLEALKEGKVDVVVGTHRLLQKDIEFKDLGLLVVDEEQRFGVKDKERLKEIKASVDCLTLTATPIPRTLHMSLLKIRDMSVLNTPPVNRHPIETIVEEFDPEVIAQAIRKEVARGGQVFYLHNRIESLQEIQSLPPGDGARGPRGDRPRQAGLGRARGHHASLRPRRLPGPRLDDHNRERHRHSQRQHHRHRPRGHLRHLPALPAARPRGPLGQARLRLSLLPGQARPLRDGDEAAPDDFRFHGARLGLQDRDEGPRGARRRQPPRARAIGRHLRRGFRPLPEAARRRRGQALGFGIRGGGGHLPRARVRGLHTRFLRLAAHAQDGGLQEDRLHPEPSPTSISSTRSWRIDSAPCPRKSSRCSRWPRSASSAAGFR